MGKNVDSQVCGHGLIAAAELYLITKDKRAVLDVDLCELGLSEYVDQTESKKDASLYLKLSSDFVKKK